jgi:hypothetical protein
VALAAVDRLEDTLAGYHAYHATRADLLRRLGRGAAAGKSVGVHGADTIQQCLNAGLLVESCIDIAAVLLGSGVRLFNRLAGTPVVLGNPTVISGVGVTHLRYPVRRP